MITISYKVEALDNEIQQFIKEIESIAPKEISTKVIKLELNKSIQITLKGLEVSINDILNIGILLGRYVWKWKQSKKERYNKMSPEERWEEMWERRLADPNDDCNGPLASDRRDMEE